MAESRSGKRYYWLKLNENFFERDEIKIIENMKNGKDYIIFYMKLLLKSVGTEGKLKFRGVIPYTPEMLSSITNTDVDTVKVAIDMFAKLELMEVWDDGTLFMSETQSMIGSETGWAKKKRKQRQEKDNVLPKKDNVPKLSGDCPTEIEKEIDIEIDIEKDIEKEEDSSSLKIDKNLKLIANKYEQGGFGSIDFTTKELLEELLEEYSVEWIVQAFKICVDANKRTIKYARGILNNWKTEGGMKLGGKENGKSIATNDRRNEEKDNSAERAGVISL